MKNERQMASHLSHLSDDELMDLLYEAAPAAEAEQARSHVGSCLPCRGRLQTLQVRQRADADDQALQSMDPRSLARQRAEIYSRLDSKPSLGSRWLWAAAPLTAVAALVLMVNTGVLQTTAVVKPIEKPTVVAVSNDADDTLYADIYQTLSQEAPAGVHTVAGIFDAADSGASPAKD